MRVGNACTLIPECAVLPARIFASTRFVLNRGRMLNALRYYWMVAKGYRLRPWRSPYLLWRMETFFGAEADNLDARKFLHLMWRERARMKSFAAWAAELRRAQKRTSRF